MPGCQGYREDGTAHDRCRKCLAEPGVQKVSVSAAKFPFYNGHSPGRGPREWASGVRVMERNDQITMAAGKARGLQGEPKGKGKTECNLLRIP